MEQFDRLVEGVCRTSVRWLWEEIKQNGRSASDEIADPSAIQWPPTSSAASDAMAAMPGASLLVDRLAACRSPPGQAAAGGPSRGPQRGLGAPGRRSSTDSRQAGLPVGTAELDGAGDHRRRVRGRGPAAPRRPVADGEAVHVVQPLGPARARRLAGLRRLRRLPQVDRLPALARLRADDRPGRRRRRSWA